MIAAVSQISSNTLLSARWQHTQWRYQLCELGHVSQLDFQQFIFFTLSCPKSDSDCVWLCV